MARQSKWQRRPLISSCDGVIYVDDAPVACFFFGAGAMVADRIADQLAGREPQLFPYDEVKSRPRQRETWYTSWTRPVCQGSGKPTAQR